MSRGYLSDETQAAIEADLPDLSDLYDRVLPHRPEQLSLYFPAESDIPIAPVPLRDCLDTLAAARYAYFEYRANGVYFRTIEEPPNEYLAVFLERFYLDDTALRLYSAAEHLSTAIVMMFDIDSGTLMSGGVSLWSKLRKHFKSSGASHAVAAAMGTLSREECWKLVIGYRGAWVHNQPPTVAGLGIVHSRERRWDVSEDGKTKTLFMGQGDEPQYTTDQLGNCFLKAYHGFVEVLETVVKTYEQIISSPRDEER